MQIEAHAAAGWLIAELGNGNRRFRQLVLGASVFPDLDAISYLFGYEAYGFYHHRITHTLLSSLLYTLAAVLLCRGYRLKVFVATQLAFYTHFFGDYFLTKYPLYYYFPFSNEKLLYAESVPLWHPVNKMVLLMGWAVIVYLSVRRQRTPLETLSQRLNDRLVNESKEWWNKRKTPEE